VSKPSDVLGAEWNLESIENLRIPFMTSLNKKRTIQGKFPKFDRSAEKC
jgi:hypothetical protein